MATEPDRRSPRSPAPPLPPSSWRAIEAIPVFVVALVVGAVLASTATAFHTCAPQRTVEALAGEVALGLSVVLWVRLAHGDPGQLLGAPTSPLGDLAVGVAGGAAILVAGWGLLALVTVIVTAVSGHAPTQPDQVDRCVQGAWLLASGPAVVLAAPVAEELFFRGFLYRGLRRRLPIWPSALVSSVLFGLAHFQGVDFLLIIPPLIVVGFGLALVFEYRRSLIASMAAHATFNLFGFVLIVIQRR